MCDSFVRNCEKNKTFYNLQIQYKFDKAIKILKPKLTNPKILRQISWTSSWFVAQYDVSGVGFRIPKRC